MAPIYGPVNGSFSFCTKPGMRCRISKAECSQAEAQSAHSRGGFPCLSPLSVTSTMHTKKTELPFSVNTFRPMSSITRTAPSLRTIRYVTRSMESSERRICSPIACSTSFFSYPCHLGSSFPLPRFFFQKKTRKQCISYNHNIPPLSRNQHWIRK